MNKKGFKKKKNFLTKTIITMVIFLALAQLLISHRLATAGEVVRQLGIQAAQLEKENQLLEEEISQIGSLRMVAARAQKMGMVKTSRVLNLTPEVPVALDSSGLAGNR